MLQVDRNWLDMLDNDNAKATCRSPLGITETNCLSTLGKKLKGFGDEI